eukprot:12885652-Prorocentrum_lima.AAC.1
MDWSTWVEDGAPHYVRPDPEGGTLSWVFAESPELLIYLQAKWITEKGFWYMNPGRPRTRKILREIYWEGGDHVQDTFCNPERNDVLWLIHKLHIT